MSLILICGNAKVGKDTLFKCLSFILKDVVVCERFAFADELKLVVSPYTKLNFGISAFTNNLEEKDLIRPLLVETAEIFRKMSRGTHWTNLIQHKVDNSIMNGNLPIVTDGRFDEYPHDELWWAKEKNHGKIIFVSRFMADGTPIPPANYKERENEEKLKQKADFSVNWPTNDNFEFLCDLVKIQLKDLIDEICLKYQKKQTTN